MTGRKPQPNDAIDLHFVIPLWQPDWVLLTEDERLREILKTGEFDLRKLRRFADFAV